jgi:rare lipoprotein A
MLLLTLTLFLGGCAEVNLLGHAASEMRNYGRGSGVPASHQGTAKLGKPYQVAGVWYYPKDEPDYSETGIASWYGEPFHGRRTANGAIYDMNRLTAAHKTLPMPMDVRVTNLENGRSVVVTINDRGPFVHGRIIDLSRRAAQLLDIVSKGTAKVRVDALNRGDGTVRYIAKATTTAEEKNKVTAAPSSAVTSSELAPPGGVKSAAPQQQKPPARLQPADPVIVAATPENQPLVTAEPVQPTEIFIQAGAFVDFANANRLSARLSTLGPTKVNQVLLNGQDFYRVRMGPISNVTEADQLLARLINAGHQEARIVIE